MIGHYLRLAIRNIPRAGPFVLISVVGLGIGLGAALLIGLYVQDELSYERWLPDSDRIYMVSVRSPDGSMTDRGPVDIGHWVASDFPQFEAVTRLVLGGGFFTRDDHEFTETITWADSNVFDVLRFPVVAGRLEGALDNPDTLVLTRRLAEKYFGRPDPIGETLVLDDAHPMTVTAVIEDLPSNTHLYIDALGAGHSTYSPIAQQDLRPLTIMASKGWGAGTYGLLKRGESIEPLRESIWTLPDRHSQRAPGGQAASEVWPIIVRNIRNIHLGARNVAAPDAADLSRLYGAIGIGALIILAAAINFVTLRTALAVRRAVEVGVRKACGGSRRALFAQFMSEVLVHVCVATLLGVGLAAAVLPALNTFLDRTIEWQRLFSPPFVGGTLALLVAVTLLAGTYPALVLASFRPSVVTKARPGGRLQGGVRHGLVALQFAIVIAVLIATIVVHRQTAFGMREALRQVPDPTVVLRTRCTDSIKDAMARVPGVKEVACAGSVAQFGVGTVGPVILPNSNDRLVLGMVSVGFGYFELYGFPMVAGRAFSEAFGTDETPSDNVFTTPEAIVLNEAGVRRLGYSSPEQAIGQDVTLNHPSGPIPTFTGEHPGRIIGVVKDFQIGSVRSEIYPTVFYSDPWIFRVLNIKVEGRSVPETLEGIDKLWAQMGDPGPPIRTFYEDSVQQLYGDLRRDFDLFSVFTSVAILISALGLVGLAAHAASARTKEIGVRKVLGSGRADIVRMLLWQFSTPVLLANVIAWPAAYFAMSSWLGGFARRIDLEPWMFVGAALATLAVAIATVIAHAWTIAGIRPVVALRHE
jgi:putative ABC transport system permease protein